MDRKQLAKARAELLKAEIARIGLTEVARRAQKPVRQINDMAAGRKSFGDPVSKEIGPLIRPDLPRDWLLFPDPVAAQPIKASEPEAKPYIQLARPNTKREMRIEAIKNWLEATDEDGLLIMLHEAEKTAGKYPLVKQTPASSQ